MKAKLLACILVLALPLASIAQTLPSEVKEPQTIEQAVGLIPQMVQALSTHNYTYMLALMILLLVFVLKRFVLNDAQKQNGALISAGLGMLIAIAASLASGEHNLVSSAFGGVMAGNVASGMWEAFIKRYVNASKESLVK